MPIRSGLSHAVAGFCGILLSAYLSAHSTLINAYTESTGTFVVEITAVPLEPEIAGLVATMSVLTFIWGVAYHYARHGRSEASSGNVEIIKI